MIGKTLWISPVVYKAQRKWQLPSKLDTSTIYRVQKDHMDKYLAIIENREVVTIIKILYISHTVQTKTYRVSLGKL